MSLPQSIADAVARSGFAHAMRAARSGLGAGHARDDGLLAFATPQKCKRPWQRHDPLGQRPKIGDRSGALEAAGPNPPALRRQDGLLSLCSAGHKAPVAFAASSLSWATGWLEAAGEIRPVPLRRPERLPHGSGPVDASLERAPVPSRRHARASSTAQTQTRSSASPSTSPSTRDPAGILDGQEGVRVRRPRLSEAAGSPDEVRPEDIARHPGGIACAAS